MKNYLFFNRFRSKEKKQTVKSTNNDVNYSDSAKQIIDLTGRISTPEYYGRNILTASKIDAIDTILRIQYSYFSQVNFLVKDAEGNEVDHPVLEMLNKPNELTTKSQFLSKWLYYTIANGSSRIYKKPISVINEKYELHLLNPDNEKILKPLKSSFDIERDDIKVKYIEAVSNDKGTRRFTTLFDYDNLIEFINGNGESPLKTLRDEVTNLSIAKRSKQVKLKTSGVIVGTPKPNVDKGDYRDGLTDIVIDTNDSETKTHKDLVEQSLKHGLHSGDHVKILTIPMDFASIAKDLNSLDFDKETIEDNKKILRKFNYPLILFGLDGSNSTFENQEKALIDLVQSTIQSYGNLFVESIEQSFLSGTGLTLHADYSHLPIYSTIENQKQQSFKNKAETEVLLYEKGLTDKEQAIQRLGL